MEKEEVQFLDADEQMGGFQKGPSFRGIMLNHLSKISQICTGEFCGGYWNEKMVSSGGGVS